MIKISYIIPVYNGEEFLTICLDSLFRQELNENEFEIICIDDCSKDNSVDRLKEYARNHSNIRIIQNKKNLRPGTTCNNGLDLAVGEYIWIVGQDDWILDGYARKLYNIASSNKLEVLTFNYRRYVSKTNFYSSDGISFRDTAITDGPSFVNSQFGTSFQYYLLGYEWRALFLREYLERNNIRFVDGSIFEDTVFLLKAIWFSHRVRSLSDCIYAYRVNNNSITGSNNKFSGELAYQFSFVAGKEVLDLSAEIRDKGISKILYNRALWYFRGFVSKVISMSRKEKIVFYDLVKNQWTHVREMLLLCPEGVRVIANPIIGPILSTVLKPIFLIKRTVNKRNKHSYTHLLQTVKKDKPLISVIVITYNQENTIAQAMDSILHQRGQFRLQIVIGEDCSSDNTWGICRTYASDHPDTITLLPNTTNLGIVNNFTRCVNACTGDYVAILAGDDYWCDEHKLQKQLDYMVAYPEYGVVCTDGYRLMVKTGKLLHGLPPYNPVPNGDVKDYYHDHYGGVYAMPLTLLIRRDLLQQVDFDEFVRQGFPVEDYPMQSVLAHLTHFGYIPDRTVVYRVYKESATFISFDHPKYIAYHKGLTDIRRYLHGLYPEDVPFTEKWAKEYVFYKTFLLHLHNGNYSKARQLVNSAPAQIQDTRRFRNARLATINLFPFIAFALYKRLCH